LQQPDNPRDDVDLLARYRDGDAQAFAALVAEYQQSVRAFFFRLCWDRDQADDLAQDLFVRLLEKSHGYQPVGKLSGFLWHVATNLWIDRYRQRRLQTRLERPMDGVATHLRGTLQKPLDRVVFDEERKRLAAALDELGEHHRLIIELAVNQDMPYVEISGLLGIPVGTVKSRMHNAIARLKTLVGATSGSNRRQVGNRSGEQGARHG
jgi:RNA polymerase sigma-70 factor (ECF subfamily)